MTGEASFKTSLATGLPGSAASAMPMRPPIEVPSQFTASTSRRAMSVTMSATYWVQVELRVRQAIRIPAPGHIRAHDAELAAQRAREFVEVAARSRKTVHADEHVAIARVAPFPVGDAVQARRRSALHRTTARL